jgi:hypothetical protein
LGTKALEREFKADISGGSAARRQYLCDIYASAETEVHVQSYPHEEIDYNWPTWGGVDFASIPEAGSRSKNRSHASIAYLTRKPAGPAIIKGGAFGQWTQDQTEAKISALHNTFGNFMHAGFDTGGKGEVFLERALQRNPGWRVMPVPHGLPGKTERIFSDLAPHFNDGTLLVSDEETPFLARVRKFLRAFPNTPPKYDAGWDVMDSIYYAWMAMNGNLISMRKKDPYKQRRSSPWKALAHA